MLFPAIPDIINDFKSSYSSSSWILSGYLITAAVMAPLAGKLSDVYAKKKVLSIIMTIFAASIAIASFSTSMAFLITVRIIQGVGLSMFIIALSIMQSNVPKQKYALANGILACTYFSGSSIGLVLGGSIIHYFGWRTLFLSLIPVVILLLVIVSRFLHVKQDEFQEIDNDTLLVKDKNRNEENAERKKNDDDSKIDNYFAHVSNIKNTFFKSVDIMGA
jgi:MFS family permease